MVFYVRSLFRRDSTFKDLLVIFDTAYYLARYPDIAGSRWNPLWHYILNGAAESRDPNPLFETSYYLASNPDVRRSGINPLVHYVLFGALEGRDPHPNFDTRAYWERHPESRGRNALAQHLLGKAMGRTAGAADSAAARRGSEYSPQLHESSEEMTLPRPGESGASRKHSNLPPRNVTPEDKLRLFACSRELSRHFAENETPLVTVVIPCFNYGQYIWDALSSVLAQTYPNLEILVIDDGSTDAETLRTLDTIKHERVRVIHQSNQGLAQTRNNGAAISGGEYLLFLDADDRLERHAVALLLYALLKTPDAAYAYSQQRFIGDQNLIWEPQEYNAYDLLWSNHPSVCSLIRSAALRDAGGYRPELLYGYEDWECWIRLSTRGHYGVRVNAPVFEHRRHGVTMTHEAHEKQRFLHEQILAINADRYQCKSVTATKQAWRPLVSVIIPFFNRPGYLRETLRSLEAQTIRDFEIILVNDGSDDPESLRLLAELKKSEIIRVLDCDHAGPAAARNRGALAARAEFLMFLDSDDLLDSGALEKLCWTLGWNSRLAFVYSGVVHFGDIQAVVYDEFDAGRLRRENFLTVTCVMRRQVYYELGGNDPEMMSTHEDYDFWLRLVERGHAGILFREPLFHYRRHAQGVSTARMLAAAAGAQDLSNGVVTRHTTTTRRPAALIPEAAPRDPLLAGMEQALCQVVPPPVPRERYRRPNLPNLFCPANWERSQNTILYLIPSFYVGGAEVFDLRILTCLSQSNYYVILVACEEPDGPWYEQFKAQADEIYSLRRMGGGKAGQEAFLRYLMIAKSVDIVFNRNTYAGYELAVNWPSVSPHVRYVDLLHLHAFGEDWVKASARYHDRMDLRYVITQDLKEYAVREYALSPGNFEVLYYGMTPDEFPDPESCAALRLQLRRELDIPDSAFVTGFIGRLTEQKDPLRWLSVAAAIAARREDAWFVMVGEGEMADRCKARAGELGIGPRVRFAGYRLKAAQYCAAMEILLLTSRYEGLPLVLLEAMAHGVPVVSSDVGGVREGIPPALGRILPLTATDAAYAAAVLELFRMQGSDPSFHARCRAFAKSNFGIERMRRRLDADLASLTSRVNRQERRRDYQLDVMAKPILS